jgi:acyl-CoA reductase-like NAD-dependent aldehyde dehydrogenase
MPERWRNRSPGDLSVELPEVVAGDVAAAVENATAAANEWARTARTERIERMRAVEHSLADPADELARGISIETGKPITEAHGEVGAVIAKIDLTIHDAEHHLVDRRNFGGPHSAVVRHVARGPAAVVAPFNFPLHLGHGAIVAYLLAGNPVIFKPSPLAANVAARYGELVTPHFPPGVFQVVQGGGAEGKALCLDPRVRAVCFTGSVTVGRTLAKKLATDFSKDLALELGGRNAAIVCADADLTLAAAAVADGACLTCGQRCNSTSRLFVDERVAKEFEEKLVAAMAKFQPGDPLDAETKLGPLISTAAVERFERLIGAEADWLTRGSIPGKAGEKRGHYVVPAVRRGITAADVESFVPVLEMETFADLDAAVSRHNATPFGLSASIFTQSKATFRDLGKRLEVGNLYANLPTTFSPSTLPFGGWGDSGNGRPGGRGFIHFATREQAVQWTGFTAK